MIVPSVPAELKGGESTEARLEGAREEMPSSAGASGSEVPFPGADRKATASLCFNYSILTLPPLNLPSQAWPKGWKQTEAVF